jgi:hypothetical protein
MSKRQLLFLLLIVGVFLTASGVPNSSLNSGWSRDSDRALIVGRNVNMVSGTKLPFGDPWLQRQNEPSIAVSTRNPMHLLAGANDYRTIDIPDEFKLPGIEGVAAADAWVGVYESFDGGQSWITTLLPGFPQDTSNEGQASLIKTFETACDPIVRAGANGLFYYCGIAFNRTTKESAIFVARYVDNNNLEKVEVKVDTDDGTRKYFGPIQYIDTRLVATGSTSSSFIDMPNMAVDIPRKGSLYGNIYVAYTVFSSTENNVQDKIFFQRSTNGGVAWSTPVQLSTTGQLVQRPVIIIDPSDLKGNTIYVAFRRFASENVPDGIVVVKSSDGGKTFSKLSDVAYPFYPFDQLTTGTSTITSFRTNSYPTMAVDGLGTVYVAWSQRQGGPSGQARIVISAFRKGGLVWSTPKIVDQTYTGIGHQFMPSLTYAGWKLMLAWYDQRDDISLHHPNTKFIEDEYLTHRHTIDVRAAEGTPGVPPSFSPSIQLSRYLYVLDLDANGKPIEENGYYKVIQAESNHINYPLFQLGTVPFHGDYLEITPSSRILPPAIAFGCWAYNISPLEPINFHTAWTDNRDVRPPNGDIWGDWTIYNAPNSTQDLDWPYPPPLPCSDGSNTGMRNQNVYTANINNGIIMGSPGNTKQLDLRLRREGGRTFVVFVKNTTEFEKKLNLVILQIGRVNASFDQFKNDDFMQVKVPPYSSVSTTVYVDTSARELAPVLVNAFEGLKLVGYVVLNPDPTNLPLSDPNNPFQDLGKETHDPDVSAPLVWNYDLGNEEEPNASAVLNPRVQNPRVQNYSVVNPRVQNTGVLNPRVQNESIVNNEVPNPRVQNAVVPNGALTDVTWTVTNDGNTTSAFTANIRSQWPEYFNGTNPPLIAQVLVYKVHKVPVDNDCKLYETHQDELIANIANPRVQNPRVQNISPSNTALSSKNSSISAQAADLSAQDVTFNLAPGDQADVIFRVWDENTKDGSVTFSPNMVIAEAVAEAVNTDGVLGGSTTPIYATPPNSTPWETPSPQISTEPTAMSFSSSLGGGDPASQPLDIWNSGGGILSYTLAVDANWLIVSPTAGTSTGVNYPVHHTVSVNISGLAVGTYTGTITISDPMASNNPLRIFVSLNLGSYYPPLIAYYPFNGNANDESGNGNNGTVNGAVLTADRFGNPNSAYYFNGDNAYIEVPNSNSLDVTNGLTIVAWVKPNINNITLPIVNKYRSAEGLRSYWLYGWTPGEPGPRFRIETTTGNVGDAYTHELLSTTNWSFVAGTFDGNNAKLFVNGVEKNIQSASGIISQNLLPLRIGGDNEIDMDYFYGKIDDVRIYNRALSPSEIQALYNQEQQGLYNLEQGLAAYYPFNENANDESGNGNNGTAIGATLIPDRFDKSNSAYSFDGVRSVITTAQEHFAASNKLTVSLWVNTPGPTPPAPDHVKYFIVCSDFGVYQVDQEVGLAISLPNTNSAGGSIAYNVWHHLVGTYDGTNQYQSLY